MLITYTAMMKELQEKERMLCAVFECSTFYKRFYTMSRKEVLLNVLDSCVGQNKSQVCIKFAAMLSIVFFKKVVLIFLKFGHSHLKPDRVGGKKVQ